MSGMDSPLEEVGPTKDTILGLLDFLVDPLLPSKFSSSSMEISVISPSQEQLVAKQVHAVVLLYNYYHRKQYPHLEFLEFESFCKVAVSLKPNLQSYLKLMQKSECFEDGHEKQLSLTEEAIINCCGICKSLDASNDNPVIEGWPITKIAIFLVDSKKENCFLFHSSITQGVWSAIEKEVDNSDQSSEAANEARSGNKKKRVAKKSPKKNQATNEASLLPLACLAVKEASGINPGNLRILENHVVYSISKEKTAVLLYIMQCTQTSEDTNLVPIKDVTESLQGPLVMKDSGSWTTTPVVEYFHLLPFADKVSNWLSREGLLQTSQQFDVAKMDGNCNSTLKAEPLPNTSECFEVVNEIENSCHFETVKEDENHNIFQIKEEPVMVIQYNGSDLEMKPLPNISHHPETVKVAENHNSSQLTELPISLECFEGVKEAADCKSSQVEEEMPPIFSECSKAVMPPIFSECSKAVKEEMYDSSHLEVKPLSNTSEQFEKAEGVENLNRSQRTESPNSSRCFEEVKEVANCNISQVKEELPPTSSECSEAVKEVENYGRSHLEVKLLSNTSLQFETEKEVEIHETSQLNVEKLPNTLQCFQAVQQVDNDNNARVVVKPLSNTSFKFETSKEVCNSSLLDVHHFEAVGVENCTTPHLEEEPQSISSHCFELKVVENYNNSHLGEGKLLDTLQPSALMEEAINGGCKEEFLHNSQHSEAAEEVKFNNSCRRKSQCSEPVVYKKRNRSKKNCNSKIPDCKTSNTTRESVGQEDERYAVTGSSTNMDIDESLIICSPADGKNKVLPCKDVDNQKQMIVDEEIDLIAPGGGAIVVAKGIDNLPNSDEHSVQKVSSDNKISDTAMSDQVEKQDHAVVCFDSNFEDLRKIQLIIASKEPLLTQTALKFLSRKREILSKQHHSIADDLAKCERNIQTILNGCEENLAVKLDSLIEGCLRSFTAVQNLSDDVLEQDFLPVAKRKKLSEANMFVHCPCQELDGICKGNGWILPTYNIFASEGGFQANVTVKGIDFECASDGAICEEPREARNSSALNMLVKLRSMAASIS